MPFVIDIQNQGDYPVDAASLQAASAAVLVEHEVSPDTTLTVVIVDNAYIQNLNRQYRQVDAPTDVLSFPADPPPVEIENEPPYLGDLVIAYPYAVAQAEREGHRVRDSLALLVVHGTLHLLGYDHDTAEKRAAMWAAQDAALNALNIPTDIVPRLEGANHDDPA
jgi:probable rRNA maturation factor